MGMELKLERYDVQILGREFQYVGQLEPIGQALDFFNRGNRSTFPVYDVKLYPVAPGGPLSTVARPEVVVDSSELGLVYFSDAGYRQGVQRMRNTDCVIAYTPHAVLRGNFHRGVETRLRDLFDTMQGAFLVMTDVSVFPRVKLPSSFPQSADLLIVNRFFIRVFHAE